MRFYSFPVIMKIMKIMIMINIIVTKFYNENGFSYIVNVWLISQIYYHVCAHRVALGREKGTKLIQL